jgi:Mn-dependent DtxR family transcriptional regulator
VKVYLWLAYNLLDCVEDRPVKLSGLATALGVDEDTAGRAMRLLVDRGYIARQHRGSAGYVYRLYLSRHQ